jgi:hypothetical protein
MLWRSLVIILLSRAIGILREEGPVEVIRRGLKLLSQSLFRYGTFHLYEHSTDHRNEDRFSPKVHDFTFRMVSTNDEADDLVKDGFEDIRRCPVLVDVRKCLDSGAIAFCFFVGQELAHIGWVALSEEAKSCFDKLPYRVHFSDGQACTGGTVTLPKYRGNGFMQYGYFKRFQFLQEKGYSTSRNAVGSSNIASQSAHRKFSPKVYGQARYLKVAFWHWWKESALTEVAAD